MFPLFFVVVRKGYCLPTSYQRCWCHIINPYLFTKFHTSKHLHVGKRVTQTCMPYCNVWAKVVYCGFPKRKIFTKTLICLFPVCHQSLYLYQVSYVGAHRLVRFANSTRKRRRTTIQKRLFGTFPIVKKNPFFNPFLTNCSLI